GESTVDILKLTHEQTQALLDGDPRRSLEVGERALALMKSQPAVPDKLFGQQYTSIGIGRFMLEEYAPARDAYAQAAAHYEKAKIRDEAAIAYELAGRAELELAHHEAALALFRKSAELATAVDPNGEQRVMARQGIGRALVELGNVDDAIAELEWALPRLEARPKPARQAIGNTRLALARILWQRARPGDRDRAKAIAALALEDLRAHRAQFADAAGARALYIRVADKQIARAEKWLAEHK
ncbi:MAG TPA: tetratricopeptide repeat protein, partial [Xanthomonadales bacterium]|nr:tetratricopeptide repeat protein [Xanthomonadales bacterium]